MVEPPHIHFLLLQEKTVMLVYRFSHPKGSGIEKMEDNLRSADPG